jgi:hypothetical protein
VTERRSRSLAPAKVRRSSSSTVRSATGQINPTSPKVAASRAAVQGLHVRPARPDESGDTLPYAVEREVEDLDARVSEAGGVATGCRARGRAGSRICPRVIRRSRDSTEQRQDALGVDGRVVSKTLRVRLDVVDFALESDGGD